MFDSTDTLLIGVDGGGTGCRVAIGTSDDGILASAKGGAANVASDPDAAIRNILATVKAAASMKGIDPDRLLTAKAHLGLAGVMTAKDAARVAAALPFQNTTVTDDRETAVTGALDGQDGFLLSIGTGAIAAAITSGEVRSVGGWGFHLADQASGAWLGRTALEQVLLCHDQIAQHTALTQTLFAAFDDDPNAIVSFSMSAKPGAYGALAPQIVAAATDGDPFGKQLMTLGAQHLVGSLKALRFQPGDTICLTGGVGPHYAPYLPSDHLTGQIECRGSALDGAFRLAGAQTHNLAEAPS